MVPLWSYVCKFTFLGHNNSQRIYHRLARFLTPIPWCRVRTLCHLKHIFKCKCQLVDPVLANIASLVATAYRLEKSCPRRMAEWVAAYTGSSDRNVSVDSSYARPMCSFRAAFSAFHHIAGTTVTQFAACWESAHSREMPTDLVYHHVYRELSKYEQAQEIQYVAARLSQRGLSWEPVADNLRSMPSSFPAEHRLNFARRLLNGEMTSHRTARALSQPERVCPFCLQLDGDSLAHRDVCHILRQCRETLYPDAASQAWSVPTVWLQIPVDSGSELQRLLAYLSAVSRCRYLLAKGLKFFMIFMICVLICVA